MEMKKFVYKNIIYGLLNVLIFISISSCNKKLEEASSQSLTNLKSGKENLALAPIDSIMINELSVFDSLDVNNSLTGDDKDVNGQAIQYPCFFDLIPNQFVDEGSLPCEEQGIDFDEAKGTFSWMPLDDVVTVNGGTRLFEFKIEAISGNDKFATYFTLVVRDLPGIGPNLISYYTNDSPIEISEDSPFSIDF